MLILVKEFISDVKKVIREITWSNCQTLIQLTIMVIFISVITGTALAAVDFLFTKTIGWITLK